MKPAVAALRASLRALARMFHVSTLDVVPRLSTATLRHLEWKLEQLPIWVLRDERIAVGRELLARDMAAIAASVGGYPVNGEEAEQ